MRRPFAAACLVAFALIGCATATSGEVQRIDPNNVPHQLLDPSTTATTVPATTTAPSTIDSRPAPVETTVPPTTEPVTSQTITLFFIQGRVNPLTEFEYTVTSPGTAPIELDFMEVVELLTSVPDGAPTGMRTAVPDGMVRSVTGGRGAFIVTIDEAVAEGEISNENDIKLAMAQIVLTLFKIPGFGEITFVGDAESYTFPLGNGQSSKPGQKIVVDDYLELTGVEPTPTTEPATTEPGATAPPDTPPATTVVPVSGAATSAVTSAAPPASATP